MAIRYAALSAPHQKKMDDNSELPNPTDFENIGRDHTRHRASKGWLNEAFGLCLVSFGLSTYDVASGLARTGYPTFPHLLSTILFGIAVASIPAAFRSIGPNSTLPEPRRRLWRIRLIVAAVLAFLPNIVGGVGQIVRIALAAAQ